METREFSNADIIAHRVFCQLVLDTADKLRVYVNAETVLVSMSPMALRCLLAIAEEQAELGLPLPAVVTDELREAAVLTSTQPIGRPRVVVVAAEGRA